MINKSLIDKMLEMPDEKLLVMLRILLSGSGIDGSGKMLSRVDEKTLRKLRCVLMEITEGDLERITYLTEVYKHGV